MLKRFFGASVLVSCAVAAGCSSSDTGSTSSTSDGGTGAGDSGIVNTMQFPASQAGWTVTEDVSFTGKGANDVGAIAISHGIGTIEFQNESANAFFFQRDRGADRHGRRW